MRKIGIVVLCGLPGVGKSTLCESICRCGREDIACVHLRFDELIPRDVEKELIERKAPEPGSSSSWKEYRGLVKKLISYKLSELLSAQETTRDDGEECLLTAVPDHLAKMFREKWRGVDTASSSSVIVLVDDNMYYRSMRHGYYQLARQYRVGFGQIFVDCPLQSALERNSGRCGDKVVAKEVIETMATRLEAPSIEAWEKRTLVVGGDFHDFFDTVLETPVEPIEDLGNFHAVFHFFCTVLEHPVEPVEVVDAELRKQSRVACSESVVYQTDQILRKLVSEHMAVMKQNLDKTGLKNKGVKVNGFRTDIISAMKKKQILLETSIVENCAHGALDKSSLLYEFVRGLFESRLKE